MNPRFGGGFFWRSCGREFRSGFASKSAETKTIRTAVKGGLPRKESNSTRQATSRAIGIKRDPCYGHGIVVCLDAESSVCSPETGVQSIDEYFSISRIPPVKNRVRKAHDALRR